LAYGSSDYAIREGMDLIQKEYGQEVDYMRIRAYPFAQEIHDYVASHERVYVVEQDRDAQLASLLKLDLPASQVVKLRNILHYNGLPLDAQTVVEEFAAQEGLTSVAACRLKTWKCTRAPSPHKARSGLVFLGMTRVQTCSKAEGNWFHGHSSTGTKTESHRTSGP